MIKSRTNLFEIGMCKQYLHSNIIKDPKDTTLSIILEVLDKYFERCDIGIFNYLKPQKCDEAYISAAYVTIVIQWKLIWFIFIRHLSIFISLVTTRNPLVTLNIVSVVVSEQKADSVLKM